MLGKLNFNEYNTIDVFLNSLRSREFDVRAASTTNLTAVHELRIEPLGLRRPPYVTTDGVVVDGRHLVDAWSLETPKPSEIRVRQFLFSWEELTPNQKAEVVAWALEQNLPGKGGYRDYAVTEDVIKVIKDWIRDGRTTKNIRELLGAVPAAQFKAAYTAADASVAQSLILHAKTVMVDENLTPKQAAARLPKTMQNRFLSAVGGGKKPTPVDDGSKTQAKAGAKAIRDKQPALNKALLAVGGYTDSLYNKLNEPGHSVHITQSVLAYHRETLRRLVEKFEEGAREVEKAILAHNASLSRNAPRR